jgi:hypothetical protein
MLSEKPDDMATLSEKFDIGICMETFEYISSSKIEAYMIAFAEKVEGTLITTMPNEKGLPLLVKAVGAKISGIQRSSYTMAEFLNAVAGRMDRVPRGLRGRKGFDYAYLASLARRHFRYVHLEGVGFPHLPLIFNLNVGMIASQKPIS